MGGADKVKNDYSSIEIANKYQGDVHGDDINDACMVPEQVSQTMTVPQDDGLAADI